jgi:hypothetical protein
LDGSGPATLQATRHAASLLRYPKLANILKKSFPRHARAELRERKRHKAPHTRRSQKGVILPDRKERRKEKEGKKRRSLVINNSRNE